MTLSQRLLTKLWWGPARRLFEAIARRTVGRRLTVLAGPLRGNIIQGGLAQILGIYEIQVQTILENNVGPENVFYDIGANIGYLCLFGSQLVGRNGHVYAFEPLPLNVTAVQRVIQANHLNNCTLVPVAVADSTGKMTLHWSTEGSHTTPSLVSDIDKDTISVSTITLDTFVKDHERPSFIKMDVEGAEVMVLEGAKNLLASPDAPGWLIEVHSQATDRLARQILSAHGYVIETVLSPRKRSTSYPAHILAKPGKQAYAK